MHLQTPGKGEITIFNRSHYEGVLVERVCGIVPKKVWLARYRQINDFERMLTEEGTTVPKFYLHIDAAEQKRRIQERIDDQSEQWKFSDDDLTQRKFWDDYMKAYERVLEETSTEWAPWYIVPANHRWFRDLLVSSVVVKALEGLAPKCPRLHLNPNSITVP